MSTYFRPLYRYTVQECWRGSPDVWGEPVEYSTADLPNFIRDAIEVDGALDLGDNHFRVVGAFSEFFVVREDLNELDRIEQLPREEALKHRIR